MNITFDLPDGSLVIDRGDLKCVMREIVIELQNEQNFDEVLTIKEASEFMKVSTPTVRKLIDRNDIPHFRSGQVIRLRRSEILEWMEKCI